VGHYFSRYNLVTGGTFPATENLTTGYILDRIPATRCLKMVSTTLRVDGSLLRSAQRAVIKQLDEVCRVLQRRELTDGAIHRARKKLKRARAGLRLLRAPLGERDYRRCNHALRDAARQLTPVREAKVLLQMHCKLSGKIRPSAMRPFMETFTQLLRQEIGRQRRQLTYACIESTSATLNRVKRHILAVAARKFDAADPVAALMQAYKKAYHSRDLARRSPSDQSLHEYRKQAKYFVNQLELLSLHKAKQFGKLIQQCNKLAEHLGDDHDLAVLNEELSRCCAELAWSADALAPYFERLQRRRVRLQRQAQRLGDRMWHDKPRQLQRKLRQFISR
jgi:CHAD domain-containing protein